MKRLSLSLAVAALAAALQASTASPKVSNVSLSQPSAGVLAVSYDLDADAVVTMEVLVNGEPLPAEKVMTLSGAVNRKVSAGTGCAITWKAYKDWPNQNLDANALSVRLTAWAPARPPDYMVCDLRANAAEPRIRYFASSNAVPGGVSDRRYKSDYLVMRHIPAAMVRLRMGTSTSAVVRGSYEAPHYTTLTEDFYIAIYEITEAQYKLIGGSRAAGPYFSAYADSDYFPVTGVYYYNNIHGTGSSVAANSALDKLNKLTGLTSFNLPTDAQWEFACRAMTTSTLNDGTESGYGGTSAAGLENAKRLAWMETNSDGHPHEVGLKKPNAWGLYDMLGNAIEWCLDGRITYATTDDVTDPVSSSSKPILRGGAYANGTYNCTSGNRNVEHGGWSGDGNKSYGFRPICKVQ